MIQRHQPRQQEKRGKISVKLPGGRETELNGQGAQQPVSSTRKTRRKSINDTFHTFARKTSDIVGSPWVFASAIVAIIAWALLGPAFHYSDTWQLVINTATTIVTFLMVFLIQNTQNRDARAIHLKLDELLHGVKGARNRLINLQDLSEEELDQLQKEFEKVRSKAPPVPCEKKDECHE